MRRRRYASIALVAVAMSFPGACGSSGAVTGADGIGGQAGHGGATMSVGVMVFQTNTMSVEGAGTYTSGNFSTWKVNGEPESLAQMPSEMLGVRIGVRYWFTK